ncbi:alpha/beta hydrolase fold-domain-containing protein [Chytriomyces sp. MP71]|nr:alpha/beta hydrolase fold-domain-containing protein [Chytriomyces sp. MP71]
MSTVLSAKLIHSPAVSSTLFVTASGASLVSNPSSVPPASLMATSPPKTKSTSPALSFKKPNWSRQMSITVPLYRTALDTTKTSVKYTRSLLSLVPKGVPESIELTSVRLPRRQDIVLDNMNPKEAEGIVGAEWVVHSKSVNAEWKRLRGLSKGSSSKLSLDSPAPDEKIILYFHGGAYFMGSPSTTRNLTALFSEHTGCRVLSVGYRLAPENPFPLPLHDAISAYASLVDPPEGSGMPKFKPEQIILAGDSAGGGLATALALWIRDNGLARGWKQPAGIVAFAPWLDLTHSQPSFHLNTLDYIPPHVADASYITKGRSHYYTKHDSENMHPYVSPLFASDNAWDRNSRLPPTLIQLGSMERLRDEGLMFAAASFRHSPMRVELYENMVHIFQTFAAKGEEVPTAAFRRVGAFVRALAPGGSAGMRDAETAPGFFHVVEGGVVGEIGRDGALAIVSEARAELDALKQPERQPAKVEASQLLKRLVAETNLGSTRLEPILV